MDQGTSSRPQSVTQKQSRTVQVAVAAVGQVLGQLDKVSSASVLADLAQTLLVQDLLPVISTLYYNNTITTLTHHIATKMAQFSNITHLKPFVLALFKATISTVSLGQSQPAPADPEDTIEPFRKLATSHQAALIYILGSGFLRGFLTNSMKANTTYDSTTTKITNITKLEDIFDKEADLAKIFAIIVGAAFGGPMSTHNNGQFRSLTIPSISWFLAASPSLAAESIKVLKPAGKTFLQQEKQLSLLFSACRISINFQRYTSTWTSVLRPLISSWYVGDVINATVAPKEAVLKGYSGFIELFQGPGDIQLPSGVQPDIYNPDISQSILKAFRIRPQIVVPSIIHLLQNTGVRVQTEGKKLTKQAQNKPSFVHRSIIDETFAIALFTAILAETRQTDTTRRENAIKLYSEFIQYLVRNNATGQNGQNAEIASIAKVFGSILSGQHDISAHIASLDQKIAFLPLISTFLSACDKACVTTFEEIANALVVMFNKEKNPDIKVTIATLISENTQIYSSVPVSFINTITEAILAVGTDKPDEISAVVQLIKVFSNRVLTPSSSSLDFYTKTAPIVSQNTAAVLSAIKDSDKVLVKLSELIGYCFHRPAFYSPLLSLVLFYLTIISHTDKTKAIDAQVMAVFAADSPLAKYFVYDVKTAANGENKTQLEVDALTITQLIALLQAYNDTLASTTEALFEHEEDLVQVFNFVEKNVILQKGANSASFLKKIESFYGLFFSLSFYSIQFPNAVLQAATEEVFKANPLMAIWVQLVLLEMVEDSDGFQTQQNSSQNGQNGQNGQNSVQNDQNGQNGVLNTCTSKYLYNKCLIKPSSSSSSVVAVEAGVADVEGGVVSAYTAKFLPATNPFLAKNTKKSQNSAQIAQNSQNSDFVNVFFTLLQTVTNLSTTPHLTPSHHTLLSTSLLLASHPLTATHTGTVSAGVGSGAGASVGALLGSVTQLFENWSTQLKKAQNSTDLKALFSTKSTALFLNSLLFPVETNDDVITSAGWFFATKNGPNGTQNGQNQQNQQNSTKINPQLTSLTKTALKTPDSTSPLNLSLSHAAITLASFYSTIAPNQFHGTVVPIILDIFSQNCSKILEILTPYHIAVLNTPDWKLCDEKEPSDLYDDESHLASTSPSGGSSAKGKKAAVVLSPNEQHSVHESTIRANIRNAISPVLSISAHLDYLIYANPQYCRDELLFTFYNTILTAMGGKPTGKQASKATSGTGYQEIYTIGVFKEICLPLLNSLCFSLDAHFSDEPSQVEFLQAAIKTVLLTHDNRTNNLIRDVCLGVKNIDLSEEQLKSQQNNAIDQVFTAIDTLSLLASTTSSLYFTPSSCSFIMPLLGLVVDNIGTILTAMNKVSTSDMAPVDISAPNSPTQDDADLDEDDFDDEDDDEGYYHGVILFSKKNIKEKYQKSTIDTAFLTALYSIAQIINAHSKPAANSSNLVNSYPTEQLLCYALTFLNSFGSTTTTTGSVLSNIPSDTAIQPVQIIGQLTEAISCLISSLELSQSAIFSTFVLSPHGLLSPAPSTRSAILSGLEKSRLLMTYTAAGTDNGTEKTDFDQHVKNLALFTFALRFDAISIEISDIAQRVFLKFNLMEIFKTSDNSSHLLQSLIALLSHDTRPIRTAAGASLPYFILALLVGGVHPVTETTQLSLPNLTTIIRSTLQELIDAHRRAADYTIKKQTIRDKDVFVSNGHKRLEISTAILSLSRLFSPKETLSASPLTTSASQSDAEETGAGTQPAAFDLGAVSGQILSKTNDIYMPFLHLFFDTITQTLVNEPDYDAWDAAVYAGSTFIHSHAVSDDIIEIFSNSLQSVLKNTSSQAQKEGIVILLSSLSHYLSGKNDQHRDLLTSMWATLIATIQGTVQSTRGGAQTPWIDSVQKSIFSALVTIASTLPRQTILGHYQTAFVSAFSSKLLSHRVSAALTCVAIIKALGGSFLLRETTLLQTLNSVLTLQQTGDKDTKLDKKEQQKQLADLVQFLPPQGDKQSQLFGCLTLYLYLITFLPQQMSITIPTIMPKILCFFGGEVAVRDLTLTLSKSMMKCASTVLKGGAKIILPLLVNGLRDQATWRTKTYTLQLLCAIVQFSSKDLSTVLPSIIPRLIELRRDSAKEVSTEAANVLETLSGIIKNPQVKKIAPILVKSLHNTNISTVTRALESLYTTIFMHYVDPVALAMIMPIVFYGLANDRSSDLKKVALQISGSVSMITSNLTDIAPYISKLLDSMQITLMDSTPEIRNVTAKAITQMIQTQQRSLTEKVSQLYSIDASLGDCPQLDLAIAEDSLLQQFNTLLALLFDILSLKHVKIPSPNVNTVFASDGTTSVQRSGCCYGISMILTTKKIDLVDNFYENVILHRLADKNPVIREGFTELMLHIPKILGRDFGPLVVKTLPIVVGLLGDPNAKVRDFAQQSSQVMVSSFATDQTAELLATVLEALLDRDYRVRTGATVLAACLLLRLAGIEGELTIAEAEDEAVTAGQIQGQIKQKTAISTEKQELSMLEYISLENRNEIYSSLFLMRSDYVGSVATVASRVWNALSPSSNRMLSNILPRLVERITIDLASFDPQRQHTAGKSLSGLVSKLGDRILRDVIPILLEKFESLDVYTRSGVCLGFSEIFAASTKSLLSPYNPDIYPVLHQGLCDREEIVRQSAKAAFGSYCRALGSDKVTKEVMPLLLETLDSYHDKYLALKTEHGTAGPDWDNVSEDLERYRNAKTGELYDPALDALDGLKLVISIPQSQRFCLDFAIPYLLGDPITQFHVFGIATITTVCGKAFNSYLQQVLQSLAHTFSELYRKLYFDNDFTDINDVVEMDDDEEIPLEVRKTDFAKRQSLHEERLELYSTLQQQEISLANNAFNVFTGLAPTNYFDILDLLIMGLGNSTYLEAWDNCTWLKLMGVYWSAITQINGFSTNPNQPAPRSRHNSGWDAADAIPLEEYGVNFQQAQNVIISFFNHDEECILKLASDALQTLLSCDHPDEMLKHITYIRTQFNELSGKSRRTGLRTILELPVFNHGLLTTTLLAISQHGLVSNVAQPTIRNQCAAMMVDVVDLTPEQGVGTFSMKLTGFLIRIFADKITVEIKSSVLTTLSLLLKKSSKTLKPFHSQLRTTLVKALLTVDAEAEAAAKPLISATGKELASAVDNRNTIQGQDVIAERSAHALSFLSKPESFFADLVNAVLLHQHRLVAGKIAKALTQIVSDRARSDSIPKSLILENIHKLLPTLTSPEAHDLVRVEVSRIIGYMVSIVPLLDAYIITSTLTASVGVPTPAFPAELVEMGLEQPQDLPAPTTEVPHWIVKQSTAMVFSSVLMASPQLFPQIIGYRPAVAFIARGFKDDNELSLSATVRFAGRVLRFANNRGDSQIVKMLVQELLSLTSTTKCPTEAVLVCVLTQVRTFAESDAESANELINVIVPLCIRSRSGAVKSVRKEIDIILYYTLLFNESEATGFANAKDIAEKFSKAEAQEFMDLFKRSVSKAVEKKKTDEEIAEDEYMSAVGKW